MDPLLAEEKKRMEATLEAFQRELATIRTGMASPALLDHVRVLAYGEQMPLNQLATVAAPESRLLVITPWDRSQLPTIEKAILTSDLGLTPVSDGQVVRLQIPALTEERRRELSKIVGKRAEEAHVALRNIRRDTNSGLEKKEKAKEISEDELEARKKDVQKLTDEYVAKVDEIAEAKTKEIMTL